MKLITFALIWIGVAIAVVWVGATDATGCGASNRGSYWLVIAPGQLSIWLCWLTPFITVVIAMLVILRNKDRLPQVAGFGALMIVAQCLIFVGFALIDSPTHIASVSTANHSYHLAGCGELDDGLPWYNYQLYECDVNGVECHMIHRGKCPMAGESPCQFQLVGEQETVSILLYGEAVYTIPRD